MVGEFRADSSRPSGSRSLAVLIHALAIVARPADTPPPVALTVLALSGEVAGVRRAVDELARRAGFDEDRLADVSLAVGEACANAVVHAYAPDAPGPLHVTAQVTHDGVNVVVADRGRGLHPRVASAGLGLGLPLMSALATVVEFRVAPGGGTEISMVFAAGRPAGTAWASTG